MAKWLSFDPRGHVFRTLSLSKVDLLYATMQKRGDRMSTDAPVYMGNHACESGMLSSSSHGVLIIERKL
jgi:hypothetical protein